MQQRGGQGKYPGPYIRQGRAQFYLIGISIGGYLEGFPDILEDGVRSCCFGSRRMIPICDAVVRGRMYFCSILLP